MNQYAAERQPSTGDNSPPLPTPAPGRRSPISRGPSAGPGPGAGLVTAPLLSPVLQICSRCMYGGVKGAIVAFDQYREEGDHGPRQTVPFLSRPHPFSLAAASLFSRGRIPFLSRPHPPAHPDRGRARGQAGVRRDERLVKKLLNSIFDHYRSNGFHGAVKQTSDYTGVESTARRVLQAEAKHRAARGADRRRVAWSKSRLSSIFDQYRSTPGMVHAAESGHGTPGGLPLSRLRDAGRVRLLARRLISLFEARGPEPRGQPNRGRQGPGACPQSALVPPTRLGHRAAPQQTGRQMRW